MGIKLSKEVKDYLRVGVNLVNDAAKLTFGREGKLAMIEHQMGLTPRPTKDGVSVINAIESTCEYAEFGVKMLKEASNKTDSEVADGTTTTSILAAALINKGIDDLSLTSHVDIINGMNKAVNQVNKHIDKLKKSVGDKELVQIATISANNDPALGNLIAEVYKRVGLDSTIRVEQGVTDKTVVNYIEGIKSDRGFVVPHFVTNFDKGIVEFDETLVLLFNGEIKTINDIADQLREVMPTKQPLLIICDDIQEPVLSQLVRFKMEGSAQICVCISPEYGEHRLNALNDLAIALGASVFDPKYPSEIKLGLANKVVAFKDKTIILPSQSVDEHVEFLKSKLKDADKFTAEPLKNRISNLNSNIAEIIVGGTSELDIKEKKDRVDDAVGAVRSSMLDGFISGGGSALYHIANNLLKNKLNSGEHIGFEIVREAIKKPFIQILENAGLKEENFSITRYGQGVDVKKRKQVNMFTNGIIDSSLVTKTALNNALSVSITALSTDILITNKGL